jgi:hypothetical protein
MMIDLDRIVSAEHYYAELGFKRTDVPWIVKQEAYHITKPSQAFRDFATLDGFLVASGEQSFLQLLLDGNEIKKAQCTTPCFRDENHDELHHLYFMKTELINTEVCDKNLMDMIEAAYWYFRKQLAVKIIKLDDETYDIVDSRFGIELGSYGTREYKNLKWIYGTGVAEPRLTQVITRLNS